MVGSVSAGIGGGGLGSYGMNASGGYDMGSPTVDGGGTTKGSSTPALQEVDGFDEPGQTGRVDARSQRIEDANGPQKPEDKTDLQALMEELLKMTSTCGGCGRPMLQCLCLFGS